MLRFAILGLNIESLLHMTFSPFNQFGKLKYIYLHPLGPFCPRAILQTTIDLFP